MTSAVTDTTVTMKLLRVALIHRLSRVVTTSTRFAQTGQLFGQLKSSSADWVRSLTAVRAMKANGTTKTTTATPIATASSQ